MKATNKSTKQKGFFAASIGLALFAIFSAVGTGITMVTSFDERHNDKTELQAEIVSTSIAENKSESGHLN